MTTESQSLGVLRDLHRGDVVSNAHGALYRVHEVMPDEGGALATSIPAD